MRSSTSPLAIKIGPSALPRESAVRARPRFASRRTTRSEQWNEGGQRGLTEALKHFLFLNILTDHLQTGKEPVSIAQPYV